MAHLVWVGRVTPKPFGLAQAPPPQNGAALQQKLTLMEWLSILGLTLSAVSLTVNLMSRSRSQS